METVLITGGNGLIGKHLRRKFEVEGYRAIILSRKARRQKNSTAYYWDPGKKEIDKEAILSADYIIHLAKQDIFAKNPDLRL